jgi:hypothetical protein
MPTLLHTNVIYNVAVGNVPVAEALKALLGSGETVYMFRVGYKELVENSPVQETEAAVRLPRRRLGDVRSRKSGVGARPIQRRVRVR